MMLFRLIAVLDQVEMRVERLRRDTVRIEEERDSLLSTLDSVKHSELLGEISECNYHFVPVPIIDQLTHLSCCS